MCIRWKINHFFWSWFWCQYKKLENIFGQSRKYLLWQSHEMSSYMWNIEVWKRPLHALTFHWRYTKTFVWDVTDLETPKHMNTYSSGQKSIDSNQYVLENLTYQSNYYVSTRISHIYCSLLSIFLGLVNPWLRFLFGFGWKPCISSFRLD